MNDKRQVAKNLIIKELRELLTTTASIDLYEDVSEVILCALVNHGFISLNDTKEQPELITITKHEFLNMANRLDNLTERISNFEIDNHDQRLDALEKKVQKNRDALVDDGIAHKMLNDLQESNRRIGQRVRVIEDKLRLTEY